MRMPCGRLSHLELSGAERSGSAAIGSSQSLVSQIEAGIISHPSKELYEKFARAYYLTKEELVAAFIREKIGIDHAKASLLRVDVLDFRQLVEWEKTVDAAEIWIVARRIVDADKNKSGTDMRQAVKEQLLRGTTVRFFLPTSEIDSGGYYGLCLLLREELRGHSTWEANLHAHALSPAEERWITSSFVIANPHLLLGTSDPNARRQSAGFIIFAPVLLSRPQVPGRRDDAEDSQGPDCLYAFRMDQDQLRLKVDELNRWLRPQNTGGSEGAVNRPAAVVEVPRRQGQNA